MIQPGASNTQAVRAVFVIDPEGTVRTILYYPLSTGRNFHEIKRIILALQKADNDNAATPADWQPGDDTIVPTARSCGTAKEKEWNQTMMTCTVSIGSYALKRINHPLSSDVNKIDRG